ncbi:MAG: hypothetical protein JRF28_09595 [Deltaproteobacteria bacterium]|nr:hypothetical protein [Deltaproteobacteria bacterium]
MRDLDEKALKAKDKKAALGQDIDLGMFDSSPVSHNYVKELAVLPTVDKERMLHAGVDTGEKERSGTYVQKDSTVILF